MKTKFGRCGPLIIAVLIMLNSGCASGPPVVPYPAFIVVDELPNGFVAGLPGVRAKQLTGDARTRRSGARIQIPPDWEFSSGASPGLSVEIFVLNGELAVGEYALTTGGYAYIPPGSSGLPLRSDSGATILYFLDTANEAAVIQTPLITNASFIEWETSIIDPGSVGLSEKVLRADPGSGARTWLQKVDPGAVQDWQYSSQTLEGYLLSGSVMDSECVGGEVATWEYFPGGYFYRPPGAVHGGPEATALVESVWIMRVPANEKIEIVSGCGVPAE
jgi:quercetin dioxygenase-like cupin family protein